MQVNKKRVNLGRFDDIDDAIATRKIAELFHGFHKNHGKKKEQQTFIPSFY